MSCSVSQRDEPYRAAAVVEILCRKGVVSSIRGDSPVHSRLGASFWLEQVATAVRWRRQHLDRDARSRNGDGASGAAGGDHNHEENNFPLSTTDGVPVATIATTTGIEGLDTAFTALTDLQCNNIIPDSIEDWSVYADIVQASLGAGHDSVGGEEWVCLRTKHTRTSRTI